jgi:hypothetical protein
MFNFLSKSGKCLKAMKTLMAIFFSKFCEYFALFPFLGKSKSTYGDKSPKRKGLVDYPGGTYKKNKR